MRPPIARLPKAGLAERTSGTLAQLGARAMAKTGQVLVEIDPRYFRPTEVDSLVRDPRKAHNKLGWRHRVTFDELVREMVTADLAAAPA